MKTWITFGAGLLLGALAGAYLTSFFLFDDYGKNTGPKKEINVNLAKRSDSSFQTNGITVVSSHKEELPSALRAEPVDPDSLPESGR